MIRVLVVDDHAVVRSGLKLLLAAEGTSRSWGKPAPRATPCSKCARRSRTSCCSTSSCRARAGSKPCRSSYTSRPRRRSSSFRCRTTRVRREAFAAGASGYVLKEAADAEVVDAIRQVADGGSYVHPVLGARMVAADAQAKAAAAADPLSEREQEVLKLLRSVTRTRRSRSSSTSRCALRKRTGRTSCGSSASRHALRSCATRSSTGCSATEPSSCGGYRGAAAAGAPYADIELSLRASSSSRRAACRDRPQIDRVVVRELDHHRGLADDVLVGCPAHSDAFDCGSGNREHGMDPGVLLVSGEPHEAVRSRARTRRSGGGCVGDAATRHDRYDARR